MNTYTIRYDGEERQMTISEMKELYTFAWLTFLNNYEPGEALLVMKDLISNQPLNYSLALNRVQDPSTFEKLIEEALEVKKVNPFWYAWRANTPEELQLSDMPLRFVQFLYKSEFENIEHDPGFRIVMQELIAKRDLAEKLNSYHQYEHLKTLTLESLKSLKGKKIAVIAYDCEGVRRGVYGPLGIEYVDELIIESVVENKGKKWIIAEGNRRTPIYSCPKIHRDGQFAIRSDDQIVGFIESEVLYN